MKNKLALVAVSISLTCGMHAGVIIRTIENNSNSNVYVGYYTDVSPEPDLVLFTKCVQVAKNKTVNANLSVLSHDKLKVIGSKRFAFSGWDLDNIAKNTPLRLKIHPDGSAEFLQ